MRERERERESKTRIANLRAREEERRVIESLNVIFKI